MFKGGYPDLKAVELIINGINITVFWKQGSMYNILVSHAQYVPRNMATICIVLCFIVVRYYHKTSNISRILVSNKIVDHSDVVGASPVGAAPTTSSFST